MQLKSFMATVGITERITVFDDRNSSIVYDGEAGKMPWYIYHKYEERDIKSFNVTNGLIYVFLW